MMRMMTMMMMVKNKMIMMMMVLMMVCVCVFPTFVLRFWRQPRFDPGSHTASVGWIRRSRVFEEGLEEWFGSLCCV